jgi:hypothetical protein
MNAADPTPPSVLIVEGDPWVRDMLSEMLLSVRCDAACRCAPMGRRHQRCPASQT